MNNLSNRYFLLVILLILGFMQAFAQKISGKVTDKKTGEPVSFMNVYYEGKGVGTTTDLDGNYVVESRVGLNELTFSFVGYKTVTLPINKHKSTTHICFNLITNLQILELFLQNKPVGACFKI